MQGHAIECRINAEDPAAGFLPSPGTITFYREPAGPGVRVDSGVDEGSEISPLYDPMIAKLIVRGADREDAIGRMLRALSEYRIGGVKTLIGFHRALLSHPCFRRRRDLPRHRRVARAGRPRRGALGGGGSSTTVRGPRRPWSGSSTAEVDGRRVEVKVLVPEPGFRELARRRRARVAAGAGGGGTDTVSSPMQGTVLDVKVAEGDTVEVGQVICIVEAMKMENEVPAHRAGTVAGLAVSALQPISIGQAICRIEA